MSREKTTNLPLNRREFLGSSARNAAGVAAGVVGWSAVSAASPSERVRVALIGVRNQGKLLAADLAGLSNVEIAALCDVDAGLLATAARDVGERQSAPPRLESDFRRLLDDRTIDAVVVATPDHWHAVMATLACEAGKDVYLESPASHALAEGRLLLEAATRNRRIVQCGLQQRSGSHFQSAVEYVGSGRLGAVHLAKAWAVHQRKPIGIRTDGPAPAGVDYDLWLGPAAARAFNPNRFHYNWHWFWEYGGGELANWGVHLLDLARWGLGVAYPEQVSASGGTFHFHDDRQTPDTLYVTYAYPRHTITWEHRLWSAHAPEGRNAAVAFVGEQGTLIVDRGGWKVYGQRDAQAASSSECLAPHLADFVECVKTRRTPAADLATGVVSSDLCHLGNAAFLAGRSVKVDSTSGEIADTLPTALQTRFQPREPWNMNASC